jgi:7-cyano-7-deazaguanine synthase in queuosine biosynthesis
MGRRVVVGFSGGVTSAWCAGWALRTYPRDEVIIRGFHAGGSGVTLRDLVKIGLKRKVNQHERIEIGACDCGD